MCPFHYFDYNDIPTASKKAAALIKQMGTPEYVFCSHRPCFIFFSNGNIVFDGLGTWAVSISKCKPSEYK